MSKYCHSSAHRVQLYMLILSWNRWAANLTMRAYHSTIHKIGVRLWDVRGRLIFFKKTFIKRCSVTVVSFAPQFLFIFKLPCANISISFSKKVVLTKLKLFLDVHLVPIQQSWLRHTNNTFPGCICCPSMGFLTNLVKTGNRPAPRPCDPNRHHAESYIRGRQVPRNSTRVQGPSRSMCNE